MKSVQQRILDYKQYLVKSVVAKLQSLALMPNVANETILQIIDHLQTTNNFKSAVYYMEQLNHQGHGPFLKRDNKLHSKMMNISKSIAVEI